MNAHGLSSIGMAAQMVDAAIGECKSLLTISSSSSIIIAGKTAALN